MPKELTLVVNTADCVGCCACEVACKQEHNLPVGTRWITVHAHVAVIDGRQQMRFVVAHCMHCSRPPCKDACPAGAITKRQDGIVLIDERLCTGCKNCVDACPLGVMQFEPEKKVAQKCDLCVERIDHGFAPACVVACPSHCIYYGDAQEIVQRIGSQRLVNWYKGASAQSPDRQ